MRGGREAPSIGTARLEKESSLDVLAALHYLQPASPAPVSYACEPPPGTPWESARYEARTVPIADARGTATSLEREGFELRPAPTRVRRFDDDEPRALYDPECAELALALTGARRAYVFDHQLRRRSASTELNFGRRRLGLVLNDEAAAARVRRHAIVDVWRSIAGPVLDTPLALCDVRSVQAAELVAGEVRYARRTGEIYYLGHSPRHRWSYFAAMERDEALVFKQFDSQAAGCSRFVPHAAFDLPHVPPGTPPRESIEVRCLVTFD